MPLGLFAASGRMTALIVWVTEIAKPECDAASVCETAVRTRETGIIISCRTFRISTEFSDFQIFRPRACRRLRFPLRRLRAQAVLAARGKADAAPLDRAPAGRTRGGNRVRGASAGGHGVPGARLERVRRAPCAAVLRRGEPPRQRAERPGRVRERGRSERLDAGARRGAALPRKSRTAAPDRRGGEGRSGWNPRRARRRHVEALGRRASRRCDRAARRLVAGADAADVPARHAAARPARRRARHRRRERGGGARLQAETGPGQHQEPEGDFSLGPRDRLRNTRGRALRVGQGFDIHALVKGRKLIVGGVTIPYDKGLDGHSDADVLIHAVCDALLGAAALGDIGLHFPDTDPKHRNANSRAFLREVGKKIRRAGFSIVNLDATLIAQAPKMAPHTAAMVANLAADLEIDLGQVNIKAKSAERLGAIGRGEGIAAEAIALLE